MRYVGWTTRLKKRFSTHIRDARTGTDQTYCGRWKRTLLDAGVSPVLTVIETGTGESWKESEIHWIAHYRSLTGARLTNLTEGGDGAIGVVVTEETRAKQSASHKGRKFSEETRARMRAASTGRKHSEETKNKCRAAKAGVVLTPEHVANLSASHIGLKKSPEVAEKTAAFWRGRHHSEETRMRLRAVHQDLVPKIDRDVKPKRSAESRAKTSARLKAYHASTEGQKRTVSDETRAKISAAVKAYRASASSDGQKLEFTAEAREVQVKI